MTAKNRKKQLKKSLGQGYKGGKKPKSKLNKGKIAKKKWDTYVDKAIEVSKPDKHVILPEVWFTPYVWAKMAFLRDVGETEVTGFAETSPDDPMYCVDFHLVKQTASVADAEMDDDGIAEFFDKMIVDGKSPLNFTRIWMHTHPGNSATPSNVDEETFKDACFSDTDWAVMFILAKDGSYTCRLKHNNGPVLEKEIPVHVDWQAVFNGSDHTAWTNEHSDNVTEQTVYYNPIKTKEIKYGSGLNYLYGADETSEDGYEHSDDGAGWDHRGEGTEQNVFDHIRGWGPTL